MKTWTNPTVEELEVKMTAFLSWYDFAEYDQNGKFEPWLSVGTPGAGNEGSGNEGTGNEGTGNEGSGDEGSSDEGFGTES